MPKTFPDDKTLEKFVHGKLSRRENLKVAWHLFNSASSRQRVEAMVPWGADLLESLFEGLEPLDIAGAPIYGRAFARGKSALEVGGEVRDRDRSRAPKLFAELMRHPVSRQRALIERTWRFKNYVFAEYLLDQSQENWTEDPSRAEDLADLALAVAEQLDAKYYGEALVSDLKARCWSFAANSRRIGGDLRSAEEALATAESLRTKGTQDPLLRARLQVFEGLLRRDQRRFDAASDLLDRAIATYREAGEDHLVGRTLISRARVDDEAGEPAAGIKRLRESLKLIDLDREPRLEFCAHHNLAVCLIAAGEYKEAEALVPKIRRAASELGNSLDPLKAGWVEAKVAAGRKRLDKAAKTLIGVRDEFVARGLAYDAAMVSLDLATVYAEQGRNAEVKKLAEEMLPIFRSRDIHREAVAALIVFHQAAQQERVTVQLLRDLAAYLRQARRNPELRFKKAS